MMCETREGRWCLAGWVLPCLPPESGLFMSKLCPPAGKKFPKPLDIYNGGRYNRYNGSRYNEPRYTGSRKEMGLC